MIYPIVLIYFQDHSVDIEGHSEPYGFFAVGVLLDETPTGYRLGHWVQTPQGDDEEITSFVVKHEGLRIVQLGHLEC